MAGGGAGAVGGGPCAHRGSLQPGHGVLPVRGMCANCGASTIVFAISERYTYVDHAPAKSRNTSLTKDGGDLRKDFVQRGLMLEVPMVTKGTLGVRVGGYLQRVDEVRRDVDEDHEREP